MRQQAIVLHLGADRQEAGGELAGRRRAHATCGRRHVGRRREQLLVDLRLILPGNDLVVGLVDARRGIDSCGAVVLPPQLAGDRCAFLVDDDPDAIGAPRRPQDPIVGAEHAELDEGAAERHPGGELVPDPIGDRDPGAQHAIRGLDLADGDAGGAVDGLVDDRALGVEQRIDPEIAHHRIGPAHALECPGTATPSSAGK